MAEVPRYVVDASTAAKWHLEDEDHTKEALAVLTDYQSGKISLIAPDNIRYEFAGTIRKALSRNRLGAEEGRGAIEDFLALRLRTVRSESLILLGYDLASRYGCSFYDGLYLALAETARCPLILADERLRNNLKNRFPWILWLGDYR